MSETINIKRMDSASELQKAWELMFNCPAPDNAQFSLWFVKHDLPVIRQAIGATAMKFKRLEGRMDRDYLIKFASSVMNRLDAPQHSEEGAVYYTSVKDTVSTKETV